MLSFHFVLIILNYLKYKKKTALIFKGSIVGTYFGRDCDSNLYTRCQEYACEYSYFLPSKYRKK